MGLSSSSPLSDDRPKHFLSPPIISPIHLALDTLTYCSPCSRALVCSKKSTSFPYFNFVLPFPQPGPRQTTHPLGVQWANAPWPGLGLKVKRDARIMSYIGGPRGETYKQTKALAHLAIVGIPNARKINLPKKALRPHTPPFIKTF